jgi:hypothetical protein
MYLQHVHYSKGEQASSCSRVCTVLYVPLIGMDCTVRGEDQDQEQTILESQNATRRR